MPDPSHPDRARPASPPSHETGPLVAAEAKLFEELFDVSPFPAVVSRIDDGGVLMINERTAEMFGIPKSEALGVRVTDYYVDPSDRVRLVGEIQRLGRVDEFRVRIKRPSGNPFWAVVHARLVSCAGQPAVLTVFTDISAQLDAERALKTSEQRLATQSNALTGLTARHTHPSDRFDERLRGILVVAANTLQVERVSMWRLDDARQILSCAGMYQRNVEEYVSGALLHRRDTPAYFAALEHDRVIAAHDARVDARTREFLDSYLNPNNIGAMLDVSLRQNNVTVGVLCAEHLGGPRIWTVDEQNFAVSTANLIAVAVADEERREALVRLAESEARARLIVDTAHDAFVGIDPKGLIVGWNAQAERTFGWTRDEVVGRSLVDTIIPPAFRQRHERGMAHFRATGEAPILNSRLELTGLHRTGREFPVEITITSPIPAEHGHYFGAFLRDISDRRERDDQLRRAKESAEAATRAKSEFLANMSHELRTPLNGVLGYAQLLQRDRSLGPAQREALDAISKCGAHLLDLINDVLDLSKIEAGRIDIEPAATDLTQLTVDLKYVVAESARRKGLVLSMVVAPDVPRRVVIDGRHLRQVLLNLLGNAIKFTTRGEVRLSISRLDGDRLLFEVLDTGVGIAAGALAEIFDAFTQTKDGAAAGGTGLGLTISHHLIRSMGAALSVESEPGTGSRFFFALPLVEAEEATGQSDPDLTEPILWARLAPGTEVTALVVDDSTVNRRILASLLESAGVRVITAAGGLEAIELAGRHSPDVIFMDLRMGDLDGLEVTRRLGREAATARIPVVAVTASTFGDTRQSAREAGCVDYLSKPVRAESLFAVLQTHLGVEFVSDEEVAAAEIELSGSAQRAWLASRLREAVTIGGVTDLERLAQDLMAGNTTEMALGRRIGRLVSEFDFEGLRNLANSLTDEEGQDVPGAETGMAGGPLTPPPATILVVDDNPTNLQVLIRTLNGSGHRILAAKDGQTALQIARQARPDLMLLDVMMPDLDGFEVCRAIKAHPDTRDIVVIFLSALGEVADKVSGLSLGAVDYITKPIQADEVLARVATHLTRQFLERELRRSRDRLDRELAGAARMQRLILPRTLPAHPAAQFAAHYQTSRHAGGDYYDVLPLGPDRFGVIVADVSGHGAPAAIVMAMIRAVVHTYPGVPDDPPAVLHHINRHFRYLWNSAIFATAVYAVLDLDRRTLRLSCAGHPPPLLVRPGQAVGAMPVYAVQPLLLKDLDDIPCLDQSLAARDRVVFHTDGVTDRQARDGSMYDLARLMAALEGTGALDPSAVIARVVADLDAFAGGHEPEDDQTLLLVEVG